MYVSVDRTKPRHGTGWQIARVCLFLVTAPFAALAALGEDLSTAALFGLVAVAVAVSFFRSKRMRAAGDTDRP